MRILLVATTISNGTAMLYQAYAASGRPGFVTICEAFGLLTSLPLMALLATYFGANGIAAAVLIAATLRARQRHRRPEPGAARPLAPPAARHERRSAAWAPRARRC